jgi:zinc D-Ala-D-Ala carboxypeptidase
MTNAQIQELLNANGYPCGPVDGIIGPTTKGAVTYFQQAYNGPLGWLAIDGIPGPSTTAALGELPKLSGHFVVAELACHHCGKAYVRRELLRGLEALRAVVGPVVLVDAYRCAEHNAAVGGAGDSMHMYGYAADPAMSMALHVDTVFRVRAFSGIGDQNGVVRHVDVRHLSPQNQTLAATVAVPARWRY